MQDIYPLKAQDQGKPHIRFVNNEGKQWVIPIDNIKTGINIYQPSSRKGKAIKKLLPLMAKCGIILKILGIDVINMELELEVEQYFNDLLGTDIRYSFFGGTPSPNQKVTMQLNRGQNCFAYVKISEKPHIIEYFQREYDLLKTLERKRMSGVPRAIDLNRIGNRFVFVQSGNKSGNEKPAVHFGRKHFDFLKELYRNTKIVKKFVDSQYYKTLDDLQNYKKHFGITQWDIIQKSIDKVASFFIVTTEFYLYHGDFTAWNMYMKEGRLWVFDFEYAKTEYPPYLDLFHFHTQLWFFVQHKDSDQIWEEYQKRRQKWVKYLNIDSLEIFYMAYLLDMIHENIKLEEKADKKIDTKCYGLWVHLLEKCLIHYRH